ELEFIHRSCSRRVQSKRIFHNSILIATNSSHLIVPFLSIQDHLKDKVKEFFHNEYELCVEFSSLIR
ncbi:hypothetical protein LINPERPRIM_LOCUS4941, partial [Linum perenne]